MSAKMRVDLSPAAQARVDLACAFRWAARYDWHEGTANHFSVSFSEDGRRFLINPNQRHFSRIRASELVEIDADDPGTLDRADAPDPTAWGLHGGVHRHCPQARAALHLHPPYATVLACLADPRLPPLDQNAARFFRRMSVDDGYGGMAFEEEGDRCARLLGDNQILLMGNHGVLAVGETVAAAFDAMYYFERAARTVVLAYQTGQPLKALSDEVAEKTARDWEGYAWSAERHFSELRAILDAEEPDFRD